MYHLKIAIADASDPKFDSSLFLRSNSFDSGVNAEIGDITQNGLTVSFENNSLGSDFLWNFGDGNYSDEENPTHEYSEPGVYIIQLEVMDESSCGSEIAYTTITVNNVMDISISEESTEFNIFYDMLNSQITVENIDLNNGYYINVYNSLGQQIKRNISSKIINFSNQEKGLHMLEIINKNGKQVQFEKIVIY